ncbi:MAG: DUF4468 domain-containing protein [Peptostreptococcaceae bacterium]|nr:DUF4468 domain-containing protein [Peptostreptococcaceae bacterium]
MKISWIKKQIFIVVTILLVTVLFQSCATMPQANQELLQMSKVLEVEGSSADDLFIKSNLWAVSAFNRADYVIQYQDKEAGVIKGKFSESIRTGLMGIAIVDITTVMTIEIKSGKLRISFGDVSAEFADYEFKRTGKPILTDAIMEKVQLSWKAMVKDLEESLNAKTDSW